MTIVVYRSSAGIPHETKSHITEVKHKGCFPIRLKEEIVQLEGKRITQASSEKIHQLLSIPSIRKSFFAWANEHQEITFSLPLLANCYRKIRQLHDPDNKIDGPRGVIEICNSISWIIERWRNREHQVFFNILDKLKKEEHETHTVISSWSQFSSPLRLLLDCLETGFISPKEFVAVILKKDRGENTLIDFLLKSHVINNEQLIEIFKGIDRSYENSIFWHLYEDRFGRCLLNTFPLELFVNIINDLFRQNKLNSKQLLLLIENRMDRKIFFENGNEDFLFYLSYEETGKALLKALNAKLFADIINGLIEDYKMGTGSLLRLIANHVGEEGVFPYLSEDETGKALLKKLPSKFFVTIIDTFIENGIIPEQLAQLIANRTDGRCIFHYLSQDGIEKVLLKKLPRNVLKILLDQRAVPENREIGKEFSSELYNFIKTCIKSSNISAIFVNQEGIFKILANPNIHQDFDSAMILEIFEVARSGPINGQNATQLPLCLVQEIFTFLMFEVPIPNAREILKRFPPSVIASVIASRFQPADRRSNAFFEHPNFLDLFPKEFLVRILKLLIEENYLLFHNDSFCSLLISMLESLPPSLLLEVLRTQNTFRQTFLFSPALIESRILQKIAQDDLFQLAKIQDVLRKIPLSKSINNWLFFKDRLTPAQFQALNEMQDFEGKIPVENLLNDCNSLVEFVDLSLFTFFPPGNTGIDRENDFIEFLSLLPSKPLLAEVLKALLRAHKPFFSTLTLPLLRTLPNDLLLATLLSLSDGFYEVLNKLPNDLLLNFLNMRFIDDQTLLFAPIHVVGDLFQKLSQEDLFRLVKIQDRWGRTALFGSIEKFSLIKNLLTPVQFQELERMEDSFGLTANDFLQIKPDLHWLAKPKAIDMNEKFRSEEIKEAKEVKEAKYSNSQETVERNADLPAKPIRTYSEAPSEEIKETKGSSSSETVERSTDLTERPIRTYSKAAQQCVDKLKLFFTEISFGKGLEQLDLTQWNITQKEFEERLELFCSRILNKEAWLGTPPATKIQELHQFYSAILNYLNKIFIYVEKMDKSDRAGILVRIIDPVMNERCATAYEEEFQQILLTSQIATKEVQIGVDAAIEKAFIQTLEGVVEKLSVQYGGDVHERLHLRFLAGLSPISDHLSKYSDEQLQFELEQEWTTHTIFKTEALQKLDNNLLFDWFAARTPATLLVTTELEQARKKQEEIIGKLTTKLNEIGLPKPKVEELVQFFSSPSGGSLRYKQLSGPIQEVLDGLVEKEQLELSDILKNEGDSTVSTLYDFFKLKVPTSFEKLTLRNEMTSLLMNSQLKQKLKIKGFSHPTSLPEIINAKSSFDAALNDWANNESILFDPKIHGTPIRGIEDEKRQAYAQSFFDEQRKINNKGLLMLLKHSGVLRFSVAT